MGERLYNPATGLFTSRDPIVGGNTTAYSYPQDPVNLHDISGQWLPLVFFAARAIVHVAVRYYAKKQVFRAANIARKAISNQGRSTSTWRHSAKTTNLAGRIYTGSRSTYNPKWGHVSQNGLRGYRPPQVKSRGGSRANFSRYNKRPTGSKTSKYPKRYSNCHVKTWLR